jgi:hypothetical protein
VIHQLPIYEIFEHNKQAFHDRFRDHAWRIMRGHGFLVLSFWESPSVDRTEFVYLLEWPDEGTMRGVGGLHGRRGVGRDQAGHRCRMVGEIEEKVLEPTEYSPGLVDG